MLRKLDQKTAEALARPNGDADFSAVLKWLGDSRAGLLEELGDLDGDPGVNRGGTRVLREIMEAAGAAVGVAETSRTPWRGGRFF